MYTLQPIDNYAINLITNLKIKMIGFEAGEMAGELRALGALPEDLGLVSSTRMVAPRRLYLFVRDPMPFSGHLHIHGTYEFTQAHTYTHKIFFLKKEHFFLVKPCTRAYLH